MKIRFEVAPRSNFAWPYFLARAQKHGSLRSTRLLCTVTVSTMDAAVEVWQCTRSWKAVTYYVDGHLVGSFRFNELMRNYQFRDLKRKWMLDDVIKKMNDRRDNGEAQARWRMGLGPDPNQ